jgi:hypothetical protein
VLQIVEKDGMKPNKASQNQRNAELGSSFKSACLASCGKILAQIANAKAAAYNEWSTAVGTQERLLKLALNEAEATAWQTALAAEKARSIVSWNLHQRVVLRRNPSALLAAR